MPIEFKKSNLNDVEFSFFRLFNDVSKYKHLWKSNITPNMLNASYDLDGYTKYIRNKIEALSPDIKVYFKTHHDIWSLVFVLAKDDKSNDVFSFYAASGAFDIDNTL